VYCIFCAPYLLYYIPYMISQAVGDCINMAAYNKTYVSVIFLTVSSEIG